MKETVSVAQAAIAEESVLPTRVQDGLLALSVGVGLGVLAELMEGGVDEVVGPKSKHLSDRLAVRHGHDAGEVTLGGRRLAGRVAAPTYAHFADRDPLARVVLERMLAGVSTRRYGRTQEPVGEQVEAVSRSEAKLAVSREFVQRTRANLEALISRRLDDRHTGGPPPRSSTTSGTPSRSLPGGGGGPAPGRRRGLMLT